MRQKYRRGIDMVDKTSRYIGLGLLLLVAALVLIPQGSAATLNGASIYADKCQSCHGSLAKHNMIPDGITADEITTAFSSGGMVGQGVTLATGEAQAIADAITPPTVPTTPTDPTPPTTPTDPTVPTAPDGALLYADNCESCHGSLATSEMLGKTATQIQDAIDSNKGGKMGSLSTLTKEQVQAIADALATNTASLSIVAPEDITTVATGTFTNIADLGTPTVTGGTPPYTTVNDAPIGGNFAIGETIVTWNTTDSDGAIATDIQKVTITEEVIGPTGEGKILGKVFNDLDKDKRLDKNKNKDKDKDDSEDKNEPGIANVGVKLRGDSEETKGINLETNTGKKGNYVFKNLPDGKYVVSVKYKHGWRHTSHTIKKVTIKDGEAIKVNFGKKVHK